MPKILHILTILMLILAFSCNSSSPTDEALSRAEYIMDERPDSALALLNTIDSSQLSNDARKARFWLLHAQAMDKNYLSIVNDSMLDFALKYYTKQKDNKKIILSTYYKGIYQRTNEDYTLAILSFMKVHDIAIKSRLWFWAGMASSNISDIYCNSYNNDESYLYAKDEYHNFKRCNKQPHLNYALLDIANSAYNNKSFYEALKYTKQLLDSATKYKDNYLEYRANQIMGMTFISQKKFNDAINRYRIICKDINATKTDSMYLCLAYIYSGDIAKATELSNSISDHSSIIYQQTSYMILKSKKSYREALSHLELVDSLTNKTLGKEINQNFTRPIQYYYEMENKLGEANLKNARTKLVLSSIIAISLIAFILVLFYCYAAKQRRSIENKVILAEQLQIQLTEQTAEKAQAIHTIKELLATKYDLFEKLCTIVASSSDSNTAKHKIANSVTQLIDQLSIRSEKIDEIEKNVNKIYNNIFLKFRTDFPNLKDVDYRLYLYCILGFSNTVICFLLKEDKISAVYDRKRRLKNKIRQIEPSEAEKYLNFI